MTFETPIIVEPSAPPRMTLFWLHGLGADGHDLLPLAQSMRLPWPVRHVLPHAPVRPVTLNGGMPMRAWFDLASLDLMQAVDAAEVADAAAMLAGWVAQWGTGRVVLAGFSQGGVVVQHAVLEGIGAAGVVVLSSWYPFTIPTPQSQRLFIGHGTLDELVPLSLAQSVHQRWKAAGARTVFHTYPVAHAIAPAEVDDLTRWLEEEVSR